MPDAEPRVEPLRFGGPNKPYSVLGSSHLPVTTDSAVRDFGGASWYGRAFHGQPTASGELYDMYAMTAAHRTMPIPSYARVRNPANGREVIVRVNDRGPFVPGRVIDLSYTAALKLGLLAGVAPVAVERLTNDEIRAGLWRRDRTLALPQRLPAVDEPLLGASAGDPLGELAASLTAPSRPAAAAAAPLAAVVVPAPALAVPALPAAAPPAATLPDAPPAAAIAAPPAADTGSIAAAPGFWLQLGAFRQPGGAAQLQRRVQTEAGWLPPPLAAFDDRTALFRVLAGPYASRGAALAAAEKLRAVLSLTPLLLDHR